MSEGAGQESFSPTGKNSTSCILPEAAPGVIVLRVRPASVAAVALLI